MSKTTDTVTAQNEWRISDVLSDKRDLAIIMGKSGVVFIPRVHTTKAQFIVTACNAHDDMLEALKEMVRMYESVQPAGGWQGVYEESKAAISKAQGGKA